MQTSASDIQAKMKTRILALLFGTTTLVLFLRFFTSTDLGYDLTVQIQAAQNLIAGKGLKVFIFSEAEVDISKPLKLLTLTHFPCGYSLYCAAVLSLGLPLALVTKIFGAVCTSFGWWGWGRFMLVCLANVLDKRNFWLWPVSIVAVACPLFFTPAWNGTDIFFWAALPWVLEWLTTAATIPGRWQFILYALVGFLCGLCILMRYASIVLACYAGFVIVMQTGFRFGTLIRRLLVFGAALAPSLVLQAGFIFSSSEAHSTPGGIDSARNAASMIHGLIEGAKLLTTANYALLFWVPDRVLRLLLQPGTKAPWLYALTLGLFSLPVLVACKVAAGSVAAMFRDVKVVAAGFIVAVPLFLWTCMAMGDFPYVSELRYYEPLILLVLLLMFYLATPGNSTPAPLLNWARGGASIYMSCFLGMMAVGAVFLFVPTSHGAVERRKMMSDADLRTFPSIGLSYSSSSARRYVVQKLKTENDLELLTNFESWFYADPTINQTHIHRILGCDHLHGQSIQGPVRFLILTADQGEEPSFIYYTGADGSFLRARCLDALPEIRLVATFPAEKVKILESFVKAGTSITFEN